MRKNTFKKNLNGAIQPYLKYYSILYIEGKARMKNITIGKVIDEIIERQKDYAEVINKEIEGFKIK